MFSFHMVIGSSMGVMNSMYMSSTRIQEKYMTVFECSIIMLIIHWY